MGKTFKSLVTEPGVTGGGSDKEGEALELQEMREASLQARSEGIFCGPNLDRLCELLASCLRQLAAHTCC